MKKKNDVTPENEIEVAETKEVMSPWIIGETYSVRQDIYIWKDAGENKKDFDDVPDKLKALCFSDEFGKAILNAGAMVVVEDAKSVNDTFWIKINGGWICGANSKITYVS